MRGVTLAVLAQESTPGGRSSVSVPSLDVGPGETFPVRIDVPLLRPLGAGQGEPAVEVRLDGILFDDLSFYGPDRLNSQRTMTVWELEARRDRKHFKSLLEAGGRDALQKEMLASLARDAERPQPGLQMARGRSTATESEKDMPFAFVDQPESPVDPEDGVSRVSVSEARAPRFVVRNRSSRAIKFVEIGWIVRDAQGREFLAASMPADLALPPGQSGAVAQDATLKLPRELSIQSMRGFVSSVAFADGSYWIPSRASLDDPKLRSVVAPSPEEQRLAGIYRNKGVNALMEELKKF